jgi:ABC-2 type transport system permease protein
LLSGFIFPFDGMPVWAQWLGSFLPLTYFVRIARGIILKGNTFAELWHNIWPIFLFAIVVLSIAVNRFHKTLD